MKLREIFTQLTHGEMAQYFMGGVDTAGIHDERFAEVIPHINLGLTNLYTRFPLKVQEVVIEQYDQIQTYYLDRRFAQTNGDSAEPIKYIMDSAYEPFVDNVLKIEQVINEDGREFFMNNRDEYWSVHTPAYNAVQVPFPARENQMIVIYRAGPEMIPLEAVDPELYDVALPQTLLEALLLFIAARVFSTRDTDEHHEGKAFMKKYEDACARYEIAGISQKDDTPNTKLEKAGWV